MLNKFEIDLEKIYNSISGTTAKLIDIDKYICEALKQAGEGNEVILTGAAPIWMYLKIAHALHGKAKRLSYSAPGQGIDTFEIFNHNPE
ncbi:MAG: hypothetical protein Q8N83_11935 [Ignavibacteria bacterium]|nr:hypothetical protein [Ignavibacteria bacterium]